MVLSRSHLYYIKKARDRRARLLAAQICREYGSSAVAVYVKMIKRHISLDLNPHFGIRRLEQMDDAIYPLYLKAVQEYQFFYGGKIYH